MFNTLEEIDQYFNVQTPSLSSQLRENRLLRMQLLIDYFDNPLDGIKFIHIAGSKGKGTVASLISELLTLNGKKTGLFLSPHVYSFTERFTLNRVPFETKIYLDVFNNMANKLNSFNFPSNLGDSKPTTFELYTLFAFLLFKHTNVEYAVLETGLGGRLDATNFINPILTIITHLELEHVRILGNTLKEIATEKGGIIKNNIPLVLDYEKEEALGVIEQICKKKNSKLYYLNNHLKEIKSSSFCLNNKEVKFSLPYSSEILKTNFALALLALKVLDFPIKEYYDLSSFYLPARFEIINKNKNFVLIDGAHTKDSVNILFKELYLNNYLYFKSILFSVAEDKNGVEILKEISVNFDRLILTELNSVGKKSSTKSLLKEAQKLFPDKEILYIDDINEAIDIALKDESLLSFGSFYLSSVVGSRIRNSYVN